MLPVCSAATSCSPHSQVALHGGWLSFSSYRKTYEVRCILEDRVNLGLSDEIHLEEFSLKKQAVKSFSSRFFESTEQTGCMDFINLSSYQNEVEDIKCEFPNKWNNSSGAATGHYAMGMGDLQFVESSSVSTGKEELVDFTYRLTENTNALTEASDPQTMLRIDGPTSESDLLNTDNDSLSSGKTNVENAFAGISESVSASVNKAQNALKNSLDTITSSVTSAFKGANEAVDDAVSNVISAVDQTGELVHKRLTGFSSDLKDASSRVGIIAVDVLRRTIVAVEDSLTQGATFVVYAYSSAKELLPPEIQNVLNLSEENAVNFFRPAGTAFQQIYITLEGFEKSLGLDPNDPVVPFVFFLGTLATLWGSYWVLTYGGYAGDLSPKLTLELLTGMENAVLIDVRPEVLREKDGIPDLRRAARFRYVDVILPQVDGSVLKLLKSERDIDDFMIAAVIQNLKIVQDRTKVIIMDADGTRSKGIARSLRRLGVKKPYLVQGGFQSWVKVGLRVKELKPETTLTILNEVYDTALRFLGCYVYLAILSI
ncbi:unnamed protein product [Ilex paraguariensis]|uniref:Rhodanese domain-containing protein n=1 Tax=Ilex paraguariensis TaxID=185542 RepID=A0ABC8TRP2_9AQUA